MPSRWPTASSNLTDPKFEQGFQSYTDFVRTDKIAPQVPAGNTDFETTQFVSASPRCS